MTGTGSWEEGIEYYYCWKCKRCLSEDEVVWRWKGKEVRDEKGSVVDVAFMMDLKPTCPKCGSPLTEVVKWQA